MLKVIGQGRVDILGNLAVIAVEKSFDNGINEDAYREEGPRYQQRLYSQVKISGESMRSRIVAKSRLSSPAPSPGVAENVWRTFNKGVSQLDNLLLTTLRLIELIYLLMKHGQNVTRRMQPGP